MATIVLTSIWNHDNEEFPVGKKFTDLDDDTVAFLIKNGAAKVVEEGDDELVPTPATPAVLSGTGAPVGSQEPVTQVTPTPTPTQEQIQSELDKAGLGNSPESQQS